MKNNTKMDFQEYLAQLEQKLKKDQEEVVESHKIMSANESRSHAYWI